MPPLLADLLPVLSGIDWARHQIADLLERVHQPFDLLERQPAQRQVVARAVAQHARQALRRLDPVQAVVAVDVGRLRPDRGVVVGEGEDAVGRVHVVEDGLEVGVLVLDLLAAVLALDKIVHHAAVQGTGAIEGHQGGQFGEALGLEAHHQVLHARTLQLEDARGVAGLEEPVGLLVIIGQMGQVGGLDPDPVAERVDEERHQTAHPEQAEALRAAALGQCLEQGGVPGEPIPIRREAEAGSDPIGQEGIADPDLGPEGRAQRVEATEADVAAVRALDRALMAGRYVIPFWQFTTDYIAHRAEMKYPDRLPVYGDGPNFMPEVWWYEPQ